MIIDTSSEQEIEESLDQILWDDFSFQYYINRTIVIDRPKSDDEEQDAEEHQ